MGQHVVVHAYISAAEHAAKPNEPTCQYTFTDRVNGEGTKTNQNLGTIDLTNEAAGGVTPVDWIMAHINLKKIHSTKTRGSVLVCGPHLDENGELHGTLELKGTTAGGASNGMTISTK